jgi:hypothetical protein
MPDKGWYRHFDDPIPLFRGRGAKVGMQKKMHHPGATSCSDSV